jgi:TPR repeat protein
MKLGTWVVSGTGGHSYTEKRKSVEETCDMGDIRYQRAAEQGDVYGMNNLGRACENGWGVKKDLELAFRW